MTNFFDKLSQRFTNFFTRSVAPSSIFFVLLYANDRLFNDGDWFKKFLSFLIEVKSIHDVFLYICFVLLFLTYGYINQIFSQFLDSFIKRNYSFFDKEFKALREEVKSNLDKKQQIIFIAIEFNDYNAYQVLGGTIGASSSYVDEVKSIHALTVALELNLILYGCCFKHGVGLSWPSAIFAAIFFGIVFHLVAKSRYKARNKRLYINFLLKDKP